MTTLPDPITRQLQEVYRTYSGSSEGEVATYIPELSNVDPDLFGIALVSLAGRIYRVGDADVSFTMQSVSKPFVYAMALMELGIDAVLHRVGVEPSGEAFNAISLDPETGRPANPMINAGAILITSLIAGFDAGDRFEHIRGMLSRFAGRPLGIDEAVYQSESQTGDRNRALAYLMRNTGALEGDVNNIVDVYFRQCAICVTAVDVAVMAATLANRGVNPVTGDQVVDEAVASHVLTVMATCGMYNFSGSWLVRVGLPAKSGVSGALVAASPGEFGIGLFSPRIDHHGNSVRGGAACEELATRFELQLIRRPGKPAPAMYAVDLEEFSHGWTGWDGEGRVPRRLPEDVVLRGLQGDVSFSDAEILLRSFDPCLTVDEPVLPRRIVLDLHRVGGISRAGAGILTALVTDLTRAGHRVGIVDIPGRHLIEETYGYSSLDAAIRSLG